MILTGQVYRGKLTIQLSNAQSQQILSKLRSMFLSGMTGHSQAFSLGEGEDISKIPHDLLDVFQEHIILKKDGKEVKFKQHGEFYILLDTDNSIELMVEHPDCDNGDFELDFK